MVSYLKKPKGSEEFNQIVDFLNASHIRYALTKNPIIYVSLIKQFWQTATTRTLTNGEIELTATIDGKIKIVTEASVRRHLQLADSDGISSLPTTEIFEQLSLIGNMKRTSKGYYGENIPLFPAMIIQGPVVQGEGSTHPESMVPQPRSPTQTRVANEVASTGVDVRYGGATTTIVESLEIDLKKTKQIYGVAYSKLIKKGRYGRDIEFDLNFNIEPVSTGGVAVTTASVVVSTASPTRNTRVSTADDITLAETLVYIKKRATKGKAAVRLQVELDEKERLQVEEREKYTEAEQARMLTELINERKRHFAAQRAKERRNKPPTQAQQRTYMSKYIKNMVGYTLQQLGGQKTGESSKLAEEPRDKEADELSQEALGSSGRSSELEIILREGNRHLYAGREGVSIVKGNSYIDVGHKALGGTILVYCRGQNYQWGSIVTCLVDGKAIIVTESFVRRDLRLADEEGVDCFPNSTIFENLALMGKPKRQDTQIPQSSAPTKHVADEAVHKELGDSLVRAATTASTLEAEQDSGNITKIRSKATPNELSFPGTSSGGGPGCQETIRDTIVQTRFENDVLDLKKTKTSQQNEIISLKRRVKKLEQKKKSRPYGLRRLYRVGTIAKVESSGDEASLGEDASK
ncbi:hypothetical protein Tco_0175572 [Tanacetum coccineum]